MSTFSGLLREIPHISVDCFDGINMDSQLFFLSHCHMDHMRGIADLKKPLYTSHISSVIVRKKFPRISDIVPLSFGVPTFLKYKNPRHDNQELMVVVTALSAGHMLGSIMLHFQTAEHSVLYTGDFRITRPDLERIKTLKLMAEARSCSSIYMDSTFFSREWPEFPQQQESIEKIIDLIRPWVQRSANHMIELLLPATYGSERLFHQIYHKLGMQIHVSAAVYEQYQYIPELDGVTSKDGHNLQVHVSFHLKKDMCLTESRHSGLVRVIRPSAMIWRNWRAGNEVVKEVKNENYRVCYSNHASYQEIRDLLLFLKAKEVFLNVEVPARASEMQALRYEIMKEYLEEAAEVPAFCPFATNKDDELRFANAQPLAVVQNADHSIDEDFVMVLPKRQRRISKTS